MKRIALLFAMMLCLRTVAFVEPCPDTLDETCMRIDGEGYSIDYYIDLKQIPVEVCLEKIQGDIYQVTEITPIY